MNAFETAEYESESIDSSEEDDETEDVTDILNFCDKITNDLKACFKRNFENGDYCDDIYEDKFKTPMSGSYSYYADILNTAQLNRKSDGERNGFRCPRKRLKPSQEIPAIHPSNWTCSGQRNPSTDAGPLEELFQVLDESNLEFPKPPNNADASSVYFPQEWAVNTPVISPGEGDLIDISSIESVYPSFIDSFYRWNADSCNTMSSSSIHNNFTSHDYHAPF